MRQIHIDTPKPRRRRPRHEILPIDPRDPRRASGEVPRIRRFVGAAVVRSLGGEIELRTLELVDARDVHHRHRAAG